MKSGPKYGLVLLGAIAVATINFGGAFDNLFREDDFVWLATAIDQGSLRAAFEPRGQFAFHRPFSIMLFTLEYRLFGLNGGLYILFNYLLHIVNALLLYGILAKLRLNRWTQILASSLFLIGFGHYGKQVMWACTSAGLLAVTLALTTILLGFRWMDDIENAGSVRRRGSGLIRALLILFLLVVAPGFHEIGLIAPLFLLLIAWHRLGRKTFRQIGVLLTAVTPIAVFGLMIFVILRSAPTQKHLSAMESGFVIRVIEYIGLMLLPIQRSGYFVFDSPLLTSLLHMARAAHLIIGMVFVGWTLYVIRRPRRPEWFLTLSVYVALIPYCMVKMPDSWLELRYVYFAAAPMSALVAIALVWLHSRETVWERSFAGIVCVGMIVGSSILVRTLEAKYDRLSESPVNMLQLEEIQRRSGAVPRN